MLKEGWGVPPTNPPSLAPGPFYFGESCLKKPQQGAGGIEGGPTIPSTFINFHISFFYLHSILPKDARIYPYFPECCDAQDHPPTCVHPSTPFATPSPAQVPYV